MSDTPDDALSQFIECRLVKQGLCIISNTRNAAVTTMIPMFSESIPQSQKTLSIQESPIESAWKALREPLTSANKEALMYKPPCRFLTLLAERKFLFIPWKCKTTGGLYRRDILVVNAQSGEIDRFLGGGLDLARLPDWFHSTREKGKAGSKVYYSDIQMIGEVKACDAPKEHPTLFKHAIQVSHYLALPTSARFPHYCFQKRGRKNNVAGSAAHGGVRHIINYQCVLRRKLPSHEISTAPTVH